MLEAVLRWIAARILSLRYRIEVRGFEELPPLDERGIVFLPNHPALIDPVIMMTTLLRRFPVRALADRKQIDRPLLRTLGRRLGIRTIRDVSLEGSDARTQVEQMLQESVEGLNRGEALLLYPAGRIYRSRMEDLGSNSAVEFIARSCPRVRFVAVRTTGLWGSSFGRASGVPPVMGQALLRGLKGLLLSGVFGAPRRRVVLQFRECGDFPRSEGRQVQNRYLERFYNEDAPPNTYVPYSVWEGRAPKVLPEPDHHAGPRSLEAIPAATRQLVEAHLREATGISVLHPELRLAHDLGLDSLARVELQAWLEQEFGFPQSDGDSLETVADALLAACGEGGQRAANDAVSVPPRWFADGERPARRLCLSAELSVTEGFLRAAAAEPARVIVADATSGLRSYRDLVTGILALKPHFEAFEGQYVGILLPASVASVVSYLTVLFAGKTPVMLNWTTGARSVTHCVQSLGIRQIVSARRLVDKLRKEGFGEATELMERVVFLEELGGRLSRGEKLAAALRARFDWSSLRAAKCPEHICVLFTSGSESLPKAVPLTSLNVSTNAADLLAEIDITTHEVMLGMLPPFHSFGLTANIILPLLSGLRVVYHPNPTEAGKLAAVAGAYHATILVGTPTFVGGIVKAAKPGQLERIHFAVTGAERCPPHVYDALERVCPEAMVLEGYGITECSPVVSVNIPGRQKRETIGELLPSVEGLIVSPESLQPVEQNVRGMLLVRGPSIFHGYLGGEQASPFVEVMGKRWYKTGDLVTRDDQGRLVFGGRLKRFVKLGGEMISLPAMETVLEAAFVQEQDAGPCLAVEATASETNPELVLFTTLELEREVVNQRLRAAGMSPLYNVRRIERLEALPLLGSGKTDYRALKALLGQEAGLCEVSAAD